MVQPAAVPPEVLSEDLRIKLEALVVPNGMLEDPTATRYVLG